MAEQSSIRPLPKSDLGKQLSVQAFASGEIRRLSGAQARQVLDPRLGGRSGRSSRRRCRTRRIDSQDLLDL